MSKKTWNYAVILKVKLLDKSIAVWRMWLLSYREMLMSFLLLKPYFPSVFLHSIQSNCQVCHLLTSIKGFFHSHGDDRSGGSLLQKDLKCRTKSLRDTQACKFKILTLRETTHLFAKTAKWRHCVSNKSYLAVRTRRAAECLRRPSLASLNCILFISILSTREMGKTVQVRILVLLCAVFEVKTGKYCSHLLFYEQFYFLIFCLMTV